MYEHVTELLNYHRRTQTNNLRVRSIIFSSFAFCVVEKKKQIIYFQNYLLVVLWFDDTTFNSNCIDIRGFANCNSLHMDCVCARIVKLRNVSGRAC